MKKHILTLAIAAALLAQSTAYADNHALIMGISDYPGSELPGVTKDMVTARELAKSMNVPDKNIIVKKDGQLNLSGIRETLDEFTQKIKRGDRVFIYFSGHGRSFTDKTSGTCNKAIVSRNKESLTRDEFQSRIQPIIDSAAKTFVFLDTCFSGGVIASSKADSRGLDNREQPRPKVLPKAGDPCSEGTNYHVTGKGERDFTAEAKNTSNYYLLGAAAPMEYSIDGGASHGGYATTAFSDCTKPDSNADQNHDGVITLTEVYQCAQKKVNRLIAPPFTSQTLTEGNGPGGDTPVAFQESGSSNPQPATENTPVVASSNSIDSQNLMETITKTADANHRVTVTPTKSNYKIGSDYLEMDVTSSKSGYLTLFSVGSSGKIFQLFPNQYDSNNLVEAKATLRLPREVWKIRSGGPAGKNRFVAIVSGTADRFSDLGVAVTPFTKINNDAAGARKLIERLVNPGKGCVASKGDRDFDAVPTCSSSYGAGIADVQEVN